QSMIRDLLWRASDAIAKVPSLAELSRFAGETSVGGLRVTDFFARLAAYFAATEIRTKLIKDEGEKTRYLVNKVHAGSRDLIKSFGFEVQVFGYDEAKRSKNFLTVSNHMS